MEKMKMTSKDLVSERLEIISKLCPGCVQVATDENGKECLQVNFELLKVFLGYDDSSHSEYFEFNWVGKRNAIIEANRRTRKTLRPCVDKSVNWNETENIYIEGDNLDALKILQESYLEKVDVIYIDPPYNTGKDFIYLDNFKTDMDEFEEQIGAVNEDGKRMFKLTEATGRFHSVWCSMMYSRLLLARNLLSEHGVCFISIDDNEQHNLRKICDEVFGTNNFLGNIIQKKGNAQNDAINIQKNHEYILAYVKNRKYINGKEVPILASYEESVKEVFIDENGKYYYKGSGIVTGGEGGTLNHRKNLGYTIYYNPKTFDKMAVMDYDIELAQTSNDEAKIYKNRKDLTDKGYIIIRAPKKGNRLGCWTWSCDKFNSEKDKILITENGAVVQKVFVDKKDIEESGNKLQFIKKGRGKNTKSIIDFSTAAGTANVTKLFGTKVFDNPKNVDMLMYLLGLIEKEDVLVLDFFSGTASTAEAVMRMNAEDGQRRKYIMVQIPENINPEDEVFKMGYQNICEIGEERIRKVAESIDINSNDNTFDGGVRVFKIDESNMKDVYFSPNDIQQELLPMLESNIKDDRTDMDLLFGCLLEWGIPLSLAHASEKMEGFTVHNYNDGDLVACFDENVPDTVIKAIAQMQPRRAVFRDSSFANSPSKINVGEIFKHMAPDTTVKVI